MPDRGEHPLRQFPGVAADRLAGRRILERRRIAEQHDRCLFRAVRQNALRAGPSERQADAARQPVAEARRASPGVGSTRLGAAAGSAFGRRGVAGSSQSRGSSCTATSTPASSHQANALRASAMPIDSTSPPTVLFLARH